MPRRAEAPTTDLTAYEAGQVDQIVAWKSKPVNPVAEAWNLTILQAAKVVTFLIPDVLVRSVIESTYSAARQLASPAGIARQSGVRDIKELKNKSLEQCDRVAQEVSMTARALATVEGAVTGVGGVLATAIDVPILFISALRTIVQIGHCYGYSSDEPTDRYFNLGILTIAMAGTLATRLERLDQLQDLEVLLVEETQVDLIRSELLSFLFQLEIFEDVPGIGIASGALLNLSFMHRADVTARRVFQERWLKENGKVQEIAPMIESARHLVPGWSGLVGRAVYSACYHVAFGAALPVVVAGSLSRMTGAALARVPTKAAMVGGASP
jgi:EcsC protein family